MDSRTRKRPSDREQHHNHFDKHHEARDQKGNSRETMADNPTKNFMFQETKVKLTHGLLQKTTASEQKKMQEVIQQEKVELDEAGYLHGSWNAVSKVFTSLYRLFYGEGGNLSKTRPATDTESSSSLEAPEEEPNKDNIISVHSLLIRYIMTYHWEVYQDLENVSAEIRFQVISANQKTLEAVPRDGVDEDLFRQALDKFIQAYQKLYQMMYLEVIPLEALDSNSLVNSPITDVVSNAREKYSVIISLCKKMNQITLYGKKDQVLQASSFIKHGLNDVLKGSKNGKSQNRTEQLSHNISEKLKLLVYQGDITEEQVDVIVNPANERLQHFGGAALAISKQGGKSIQRESDDIMKRRKLLHPGDVEITTAGNLPSNFVIHAVGPQWSDHSMSESRRLLRKAVLNSLRIACQNKARKIAIPAISSGIYGMPVGVCAEVLFNTVEEFSKKATNSESLEEVRFVNKDKPTVQVFEQEMKKRYGKTSENEGRNHHSVSGQVTTNVQMFNNPDRTKNFQQIIGSRRREATRTKEGQNSQQNNNFEGTFFNFIT